MKVGRITKKSKSSKSSFVLMIGDEGGILLHIQNKKLVKRVFAQSPENEHVRSVDELLKTYPKAPITLLVDMMDQSYIRQTLPPVSSFNVGKIVRRRLNKDFSADDIKGYVIFGRDKKGRRDWNYLMASLAKPPLLQKWIDFIVERPNTFRGLGLVPLECQPLIKAIESAQLAQEGKDAKPNEWHILISHHKVGGFRQIVLKNGQLMFTRLAQLVGEPTPEVIAGNIEQEVLNTLEYLKRLGLQDTNTLTATIVASKEIQHVFDPKTIRAGKCHFYTPYELASLLSLRDIAKPEDHFGDVVVAGFIGTKRKLLLTLFTAYTQKIAKLNRYILSIRAAAVTALLAILSWEVLTAGDMLTVQQATEELQTTHNMLTLDLNKASEEKKKLPSTVNTYVDIATLFSYYGKSEFDLPYFVHTLAPTLENLAVLRSFKWSQSASGASTKGEDSRQTNAEFDVLLITPQEPRDVYTANAEKLVAAIKKAFDHFDVTNSELPAALAESKEIKTVISDADVITSVQNTVLSDTMKFSIKGPSSKNGSEGELHNNVMMKNRLAH